MIDSITENNIIDTSKTAVSEGSSLLKESSILDSSIVDDIVNIKTIWGIEYDFARILIPVIVTLIVFLTGQFISWVKSKYERRNELKSIKTTIEQWIILIKPTITTQIAGLNEFSKTLKNTEDIHPERFKTSSMLVNKLQQLELRDLIDTIMVNLNGDEEEKAKLLFNIVSQVEFLSKIENHLIKNYENFKSYTLELMEEWNNGFMELNTVMNETSYQINQVEPNCEFVVMKNKIADCFLRNKETQPVKKILDNFIYPLETEVNKYLQTSENKRLILNLAYKIDNLKITHKKWEAHKKGHILLANDFSERIDNVYKVLEDVVKKLKTYEFNNVFKIKN